MLRFVSLLVPAFLFLLPCLARTLNYQSRVFSVAHGLSQSSVYSIAQDKDGFLWIGTQDGLNKYDGLSCKVYRNEPFDSLSIPSGIISSLFYDSKDRLWIGTAESGLCLFLPASEQFRNFFPNHTGQAGLDSRYISCIAEDKKGTLWIGTDNGLYRMHQSGDGFSFECMPLQKSDSLPAEIFGMHVNGDDEILLSTWQGVIRVNGLQGRPVFTPVSLPPQPYYRFQPMVSAAHGKTWIALASSVFSHEAGSNEVTELFSLPNKEKITTMVALPGIIWLGTNGGLYSVHPGQPVPVRQMPGTIELSNGIMTLHADNMSRGMLWVGSDVNGLVQLAPVQKNFHSDNLAGITQAPFVFSIYSDPSFTWLGTKSGLIRISRDGKPLLIRAKPGEDGALASDFITSIHLSASGLWVGSADGLQRVEQPASAHPRFIFCPVNPQRKNVRIRCLSDDPAGNLLVALPKKLYRRDSSGRFVELLDISRQPEGQSPAVIITSVWVDTQGRYWVGTTNGISLYDSPLTKPQWITYSMKDTTGLRNNMIQNIRGDNRGNLWVSTFNGFSRLTVKNGKVLCKNYSTRDGLVNNTVYGCLEDTATGMLWLSTNGGLSRFDPVTEKFINYTHRDGLQSNEFNGNAFFRSAEGRMFFGGVNGYTSFFPSDIRTDTVPPKIVITGYTQDGASTQLSAAPGGKKITLPYNRNSLTLDFIALHYADPSRNQYAYRLEGHDSDWIAFGTNRQVNFSELAPGTYVFRVVASNADGVYNWSGDTLTIVVDPPFWKTPWFFLLLGAVLAGALAFVHRYRLRLKEQQMREIEKIRRDTAADFHDELGHRLTTISWFSEVMKKKIPPGEKELQSYVDKIIDTSAHLYHTMKDLVWAMDPKKDSVLDLYSQLKVFGEGIFDQTGIRFDVQPAPPTLKNQPIPLIYKRHVLLILKEAMHNSFKHSHCTETLLKLSRENGSYALYFRDNGRGFDPGLAGNGNGLKNIRKRAELIHANAEVESSTTGTSLTLTFHVPE